jgi:hypothetical protein
MDSNNSSVLVPIDRRFVKGKGARWLVSWRGTEALPVRRMRWTCDNSLFGARTMSAGSSRCIASRRGEGQKPRFLGRFDGPFSPALATRASILRHPRAGEGCQPSRR